MKKNCNLSLTKGGSIMIETFDLGDIVQMKKQHPCGSKEFEVIRLGADIKIKCVGCVCKYSCRQNNNTCYI